MALSIVTLLNRNKTLTNIPVGMAGGFIIVSRAGSNNI